MPEPMAHPEPAPDAPTQEEARSLRDLLPTGTPLLLVAATSLVLIVASFSQFGLHGHA